MKEFGDKIPEDKRKPIEEALNKLKEAHKQQDLDAVEKATTELNNAWSAASQEIYNAQQSAGQAGGNTNAGPTGNASQNTSSNTGSGNDDEVTDVDFEEVK